MRIIKAEIFLLKIPFNFTFGHFLKLRFFSDSIVVKLTSDTGQCGYGEGLPRPYVTGETVKMSLNHIKSVLLPAVTDIELPMIDTQQHTYHALSSVNTLLPDFKSPGIIAWNASKTAIELALVDCILKNQRKSLLDVLPPRTDTVTYSAVLPSANSRKTSEFAEQFKKAGMKYIKLKVAKKSDRERIALVRDIIGEDISMRLDANGAFSAKKAIAFIKSVEKYNIDSIEQPVKRGDTLALAEVKANSSIPIMADESIVTLEDAMDLIKRDACDFFNLRISKCGGLYNTLKLADLSAQEGMKIQLGCQVGETAILSAAGRHVAAFLDDVKFIEGSYSTYLLAEDISLERIAFGDGGVAPVLSGMGLGINIKDALLEKYAKKILHISNKN